MAPGTIRRYVPFDHMALEKSELLAAFAEFRSPHEVRKSPRREEVLSSLGDRPEDYVALVAPIYEALPAQDDMTIEECAELGRLVDILRELLFADGRTLEALLWIARFAADHPEHEDEGINPLAAIRFLCDGPLPRHTDEEMIAVFTPLMDVPALEHNARECRNAIFRRRRDLAPAGF